MARPSSWLSSSRLQRRRALRGMPGMVASPRSFFTEALRASGAAPARAGAPRPLSLEHLLGDRARDLAVLLQRHRVRAATLGRAAQRRGVREHLRDRDQAAHDAQVADRVDLADLAAARVEVADDGTEVVLGHAYLDLHDRLEQRGV